MEYGHLNTFQTILVMDYRIYMYHMFKTATKIPFLCPVIFSNKKAFD